MVRMMQMGKIVLHTRQRKLLSILNEQKGIITGIELASKMEVSDRTVRNDILQLNKILEKINIQIESIRGKGYILHVEDNTLLYNLIYTESSLVTQEDRVRYLTIRLICSDEATELGDLEDEMFISRTTLEKDIRIIKERYLKQKPYLRLIRQENIIYFEEDEEKKRVILNELFSREWDYNSEDSMYFRDSFFDAEIFDTISVLVKEVLKKYEIMLSDIGLVHFIFIIAIAHIRIEDGYTLSGERHGIIDDSIVSKAVDELSNELEKILNISFNQSERYYFVFSLMQKRLLNSNDMTKENITEYVDNKFITIVNDFLNDIKKEYFLDLTSDDELFIRLVLHVRSVVSRLKYSNELKSTILHVLKNKYPITFEMSILFKKHLKNMFNIEMEENELSYIAAHLGASIKKLVDSALEGKIKIAVASHLNSSSTQLLITKLKSIYGQTIQLVGPFAIYEKEKIAASNAELVLSTVNIKDLCIQGSKLLFVSTFLENQELDRINKYLEEMKRDIVHPKLPLEVKHYFDKELFYYGLDMKSREEVITFLSEELQKKAYVSPNFLNSVMDRENISSTAFESGIAMPHPLSGCCNKTVISVAILNKPILWNDQKVQCIFLLAIKDIDKKYMIRFFDIVVEKLNNTSKLKKILEADTFEEFIDIII